MVGKGWGGVGWGGGLAVYFERVVSGVSGVSGIWYLVSGMMRTGSIVYTILTGHSHAGPPVPSIRVVLGYSYSRVRGAG